MDRVTSNTKTFISRLSNLVPVGDPEQATFAVQLYPNELLDRKLIYDTLAYRGYQNIWMDSERLYFEL